MKYIQYYNENGEHPGMIIACNDFEAASLPEGISQMSIPDHIAVEDMMVDLGTNLLIPAIFQTIEPPPSIE
jgi:hypothetical protein